LSQKLSTTSCDYCERRSVEFIFLKQAMPCCQASCGNEPTWTVHGAFELVEPTSVFSTIRAQAAKTVRLIAIDDVRPVSRNYLHLFRQM
jgi:hypothetical protein